ncbi:hypothetical protein [Bradyrhizobium sp. sBnM-33]|uniref:hypothetical protein n=1 Tax=Bradyrhizobium sp. sBnM-33 TaxID=2831780 RepID=UPI001BD02FA3|nr:hypothetical protein [Bradyrhizobium sp. sBnM-33]WOH50393.1 hypothetical protein RX328_41330 [Bradyrhizobium sp. sBnM-33]
MAEAVKNARRSDEAERSRHLAATESVAFATMLLGLLNDADAALHRVEHEPARAAEPAALHPPPAEIVPAALQPADPAPGHDDQHAGTIEPPAADLSPAVHAEATATSQPQDAGATLADVPSADVLATQAFASTPVPSGFSAALDHAPSAGANGSLGSSTASPSFDLGASVHNFADSLTGIVDTALATVSNTIANVSATVGQLTATVTGTASPLLDGLTGTVTGLIHDAPAPSLLEPLTTNLSGQTSGTTDFSGAAQHDVPLLDTAGAIPTSLLHPIPLQLGFLGQPTMDGHEPHDGAFSALGIHHF